MIRKAFKHSELSNLNRVIYSEQWLVRYEYFDGKFWKRAEILYCTHGKDEYDEVEKQFKRHYPKADLITIRYQ